MRILLPLLVLAMALPSMAQDVIPQERLDEISERGRLLFEYDRAVAVATAAAYEFVNANDEFDPELVRSYSAVPTDDGWEVAFGQLAEDHSAYLVSMRARIDEEGELLGLIVNDAFEVETGRLLDGALAVVAMIESFSFSERPYNFAVIPAGEGQLFSYVIPAQTEPGLYPLGGDARYRFVTSTKTVTEEVDLHPNVQLMASELDGELVSGTLSVSLDGRGPVETDVFLAMHRTPPIPHFVVAGEWVYEIDPNGSITPIPAEEFGGDDPFADLE